LRDFKWAVTRVKEKSGDIHHVSNGNC
jgi:hypothetical protein